MMYTGLRRGELCALQWKDIDFENKLIHISKSISFVNNRPRLKPPKTKTGIRSIPLLDAISEYLNPAGHKPEHFIFGGAEPFSETMIKRRWNHYISLTELNITQHQLRHTFATLLYKSGIDVKTAQSILGHADIETTLGRYTHIEQTLKVQNIASNKLNEYIKNNQ